MMVQKFVTMGSYDGAEVCGYGKFNGAEVCDYGE